MLIGVMDIVFTFGGQVNWMRYIISMRTPSKFPLAVAAVSGVMTTAYVAIGSIGCAPARPPSVLAHTGQAGLFFPMGLAAQCDPCFFLAQQTLGSLHTDSGYVKGLLAGRCFKGNLNPSRVRVEMVLPKEPN